MTYDVSNCILTILFAFLNLGLWENRTISCAGNLILCRPKVFELSKLELQRTIKFKRAFKREI